MSFSVSATKHLSHLEVACRENNDFSKVSVQCFQFEFNFNVFWKYSYTTVSVSEFLSLSYFSVSHLLTADY